ncbi:MAG TPA: malate dehydrogenase, partial [Vicinamibacterales bacterium]|nr:malate dehydrogenase [Vicinamibacterales bacterium]
LNKIALVGGGNIGGVLAQELFQRKLAATVAMVDVKGPDVAKGKCLDIAEGTPIIGSDVKYIAGKDYGVIEGADLVINTAGVPRTVRPDGTYPSREELLATNLQITDAVAGAIRQYCPDAIVVSIANPLDAIVFRLHQKLSPPKHRLMGMAGALDSARYRYFVAQAAGVSVENVEAMVLGGHGDDMVPVRSCCRIAGMPVEKFLDEPTLAGIEARTRKAGGEIVGLIGVSAFWSPAIAALEMVEAIVLDKRKIIASCVLLEGEYGVNGLFVGVPVVLGRNGVERVIEVDLTEAERAAFAKSIAAVKKTTDEVIAAK